MNLLRPDLRLDWCSHTAAKYSVARWHYSQSLSSGKNVYIGVWEDGEFIGTVVFGLGSGNATNGERFGLSRCGQVAELTRVALSNDHRSEVSRIVGIAIRMLKKQSPGLRLVISFADPAQGHHGGIYQAGNWIFAGKTAADVEYRINGKWHHHRTATARMTAKGLPARKLPAKFRYLMPLDGTMRKTVEAMAQTYPKRAKQAMAATHAAQRRGGTDRHAPNLVEYS